MAAKGPAKAQDGDILYVGLDLGTSQSSISTSTDLHCTVTSVVGWPKDLISYKFLQKQVVMVMPKVLPWMLIIKSVKGLAKIYF